jgi:hypothetical protein
MALTDTGGLNLNQTPFNSPALLMKTPLKLMDIGFAANSIKTGGFKTVLLYEEFSLNIFLTRCALDKELKAPLEYGFCVNLRDKNAAAAASDIISALETNFKYLFLKEPSYNPAVKPVCHIASYDFIAGIKNKYASKFKIIVQNCFLHENDEKLLAKQLDAGADFIAAYNKNLSGGIISKYHNKLILLNSSGSNAPQSLPETADNGLPVIYEKV